ncbi:MAG: hypothetical protein IKC11_02885 [Clostridia bacterium]|nr:hypothetical protein [Clostridia bacterium]
MSFANESEILVNGLVQAEYKNACEKWGIKYNSMHEGFAVLLEEVEEVEWELIKLKANKDQLWNKIKGIEGCLSHFSYLSMIEEHAINGIQELAQVIAVVQKLKNTAEVKDDYKS